MINLKVYPDSTIQFYKTVADSKNITKKDPEYKNRLKAFEENIEKCFKNYDDSYAFNKLQELISLGYKDADKDDLQFLYSYKSKIMQSLKVKLTTTELNRVISTCQNCTIGEVNSFDHLVPKEEFAEFAVNPKNLFPSCSKCNGYKNVAWRQGGKRVFLNLYLDALPEQQYLFVTININGKDISTTFYIDNPHGIDDDTYQLIYHHYSKLYLCERFNENVDVVITPLINSIESNLEKLPLNDIIETSIATSQKNMKAFGHNYWKSLLEIALLNNKDFTKRFE